MTRLRQLGAWAALAAGIAWFAKVGYIAAVGAYDEPMEGPLFLLGLALPLLGAWAVATRLADRPGRRIAIYAATVAGHILATALLSAAGEAVVPDDAPFWLQGEAGILAMATLWTLAGLWLIAQPNRPEVASHSGLGRQGTGA